MSPDRIAATIRISAGETDRRLDQQTVHEPRLRVFGVFPFEFHQLVDIEISRV